MATPTFPIRVRCIPLLALLASSAGCVQEMANQPRVETYEGSGFFRDGQGARPLPTGTIARGQLADDPVIATGKRDGRSIETIPLPVTAEFLQRGRERFHVFCDHCHGPAGYGDGMVVQRGFPRPPSYHSERVRSVSDGHIFEVITAGFGQMPAFHDRITPADRWAIAAYVRALQLSQHSRLQELPEEDRARLRSLEPTSAAGVTGTRGAPTNTSDSPPDRTQ